MRLGGAEFLAGGDEQEGLGAADQGGEPLGAAPGGHDREVGLVEADPDVVGGDPDVGGHGDLGAAAEGMAVERGNDRSGKGGNPVAQAAHADGHRDGCFMGADLREFLEVAAGDEGAVAAAADNQDVSVGGGVQRMIQGVHGGEVDGVARAGAVDGQDRDAFAQVQQYLGHIILRDDIGILCFRK